eukprot:COSAG01_NODE_5746_length_4061_cov_324.385411_5_plen_360_part_00
MPPPRRGLTLLPLLLVLSSTSISSAFGLSMAAPPAIDTASRAIASSAAPPHRTRPFTPKGRYGHCIFAVGRDKMYVLGGRTHNSSSSSDELLVFDLPTRVWTRLNDQTTGDAPPGIEGQTCTPDGSHVYVAGGNLAGGPTSRTWVLNLTVAHRPRWTAGPGLPIAVRRHTAVLASARLVLFGGSRGPSCQEELTDAVVLAGAAYGTFTSGFATQRTIGAPPAPRMGHVAVVTINTRNEMPGRPAQAGAIMYVVAGQTSNNCSAAGFQNDVHVLDLSTWRWRKLRPEGVPPARRYGATGWWNTHDGGSVQITGGTCGKVCGVCGHTNDTFLLRTRGHADGAWVRESVQGSGPPPQDRHSR